MKPFDEAKHLPSLFRQLGMFAPNGRLKLFERIREIAIERLAPITTPGTDLRNFDYAAVFYHDVQENPEYTPYRDAANVLNTCSHAMRNGKVDEWHIDSIKSSYGGLDERWIAKLKQLRAPREKKNKALLKYCSELMQAKPSPSATHLFRRIPKKENAATVDGFTIYRADIDEDGEEKIYSISPTGKPTTVGDRPFHKYFNAAKESMNDNS